MLSEKRVKGKTAHFANLDITYSFLHDDPHLTIDENCMYYWPYSDHIRPLNEKIQTSELRLHIDVAWITDLYCRIISRI
jgi:hypothetical protein